MRKIDKSILIDILMIALGCAIYALSLDMISVPNKLADGGLSGISLLLRHFWGHQHGTIDPCIEYSTNFVRLSLYGQTSFSLYNLGNAQSFLFLMVLAFSTYYKTIRFRTRPLPFSNFCWVIVWNRIRVSI